MSCVLKQISDNLRFGSEQEAEMYSEPQFPWCWSPGRITSWNIELYRDLFRIMVAIKHLAFDIFYECSTVCPDPKFEQDDFSSHEKNRPINIYTFIISTFKLTTAMIVWIE